MKFVNWENQFGNSKLQIENSKLKFESWNLKFEIVCGNTVQLWPPTVASHCGLPLWEAMGIPLKIALNQFAYVFLREATGGHSWRPWEYHSQLLLINLPMFSYGRPREATGGHGNTARAFSLDLNSLFLIDVRTPSSVR